MTPDSHQKIPEHIAVIMDGNNRWARARGLPTRSGHRQGAEAAREITYGCVERNIKYLTLFAFSSENWTRPSKEVQSLMALFLSVLKRHEIRQLHEDNVRLRFIGKRSGFSSRLQASMADAEALTRDNTGTVVTVAADYGGRWDITEAAREAAARVADGSMQPDEINVESLHQFTSLADYPDPDLCIRTGGEHRISNFLLWQFAYTELYFTDCFWPDFGNKELQLALDDFASRKRRYGGHDTTITEPGDKP
ncbi:MAG: polyprenyl diphosphate synthase [Pseudohongiellaceae bacterium]|jgi:undecaprenyl diphosphate synthase